MIRVWTDGSSSPTTRNGGWAFFLRHPSGKETCRFGAATDTTNNAMELMAIIKALEFVPVGRLPLIIHTDSEYAQKALTVWVKQWHQTGWTGSTGAVVKNQTEIKAADRLLNFHRQQRQVMLLWVKGHAGIEENEQADFLAGRARREQQTNWQDSDCRVQYNL